MAQKLCQELLTSIFEQCLNCPEAPPTPTDGCMLADSKRSPSPHGTLCSAARVCRSWNTAASHFLYSDPGPSICRYEGLYIPHLIASLRKDTSGALRDSVKSLTITASLEAGLWISNYACEGDLFCELVELCPRLRSITVPSFEVACRERVVATLRKCVFIESFNIRVYLESSRRDPRFAKLIPYDSWKLLLLSDLMTYWPNLKEMTVRHIPDNSYHLIPDIVLKPPKHKPYNLLPHRAQLTTLSLRETFIDDQGLFHLLSGSNLTSLCLMSCQGITSSAITRQGLLDALKLVGPTVKHLRIMTPWLPGSANCNEPERVVDMGLGFCTALKTLCVAGYDVTNAFIRNLPNPQQIETLEIMDFELVTPQILFEIAPLQHGRQRMSNEHVLFPRLRRLAVWQRNAGVGRARVSNGWFRAAFGRSCSPAITALDKHNILLGTGWESRLISGSDIDYHHPADTATEFETLDKLSPV